MQKLFETPIGEDHSVRWTLWLTPQGLGERVKTLSHVALLEGEEAERFWTKFDETMKGKDTVWNERGEVEVHAVSPFAWTTKL